MTNPPHRPRDPNQRAKAVVDIAAAQDEWREWGAMFGFTLRSLSPEDTMASFVLSDDTIFIVPKVARDAMTKAYLEALDQANRLGRRGLSPGDKP